MKALVSVRRCLALVACSLAVTSTNAAYTFTILPTPSGGYSPRPTAINNVGQIIGMTSYEAPCFGCGGSTVGTLWTVSSVSLLGGYGRSEYLSDINDSGQVAGTSFIYTGTQAAFWSGGIPYTLVSGSHSAAWGINNLGQIAGAYEGFATIWNGLSGPTYPEAAGTRTSSAVDINDQGQILGRVNEDPVVWTNGVPAVLGTLGGYSDPRVINNLGQVIGYSTTLEGYQRAALWTGTNPVELGSFGGNSYAVGINDLGLIVGAAYQGDVLRAVIWQDGQTLDLNSLVDPSVVAEGWTLFEAVDINNAGQIVGTARNTLTGQYAPYLLNPVPEPSSLALLCVGLGYLVLARRRTTKAHHPRSLCPAR